MDSWFAVPVPRPEAVATLFWFPHAGSGAVPYRALAASIRPEVEVRILVLPGREQRLPEPRFTGIEAAADAVTTAVMPFLDRPFVLGGHSMGSLLAFECARLLRQRGLPVPHRLLLSGYPAPHLRRPVPDLRTLPYAQAIEAVRRYAGTPEALLADAEFMQLVLEILADDLAVCRTYQHAGQVPLPIPMTVLGGRDDDITFESLAAWSLHTSAGAEVEQFEGGHFYLKAGLPGLASRLNKDLGLICEE